MPLYEYWCPHCEVWFETIRPMSRSQEPAPCPKCSQPAPRQMPSSFSAFVMRGGYPRGIPDKGQAYGPVGPYTTYATPEQKAKAAEEERRSELDYGGKERAEKAYRAKHDPPASPPASGGTS